MTAPGSTSRNLWPLVVTAFVLMFAGLCVGFVVWSLGHRSELVQRDYYEQELRHNDHMKKAAAATALGSAFALEHDAASDVIALTFPPAHAAATGTVTLFRPSDASLDDVLPLMVATGGTNLISLAGRQRGLWRVAIDWVAGGQAYFAETRVFVTGAARAQP